jgi:hypothetical protein
MRLNDYEGIALTSLESKTGQAELWTKNLSRAHELAYLLILSRSGKILDQKGFHKLHAMAVVKNQRALVLSMDSGGGKSTIAWNLCQNFGFRLLSDDTPLFDDQAGLWSFPLRLGLSEVCVKDGGIDQAHIYELERREYGLKKLLSVEHVAYEKVGVRFEEMILVFARRASHGKFRARQLSVVEIIIHLIRPMLIGIGLPIIFEYFWENGIEDFFTKAKIALKRMKAIWNLARQVRAYEVTLGNDLEESCRCLDELVISSSLKQR